MMRFLFALFIIGVVHNTLAAPLSMEVCKVEEDLPTSDPSTLGPSPNIDVYHVRICNPNDADVTSLELDFPGNWVNNGPFPPVTFRDDISLPTVVNFTFAETFFVLPAGTAGTQIRLNTTDNNSLLSSDYTLPGTTALVPAGGSAVVAVLSVPTGARLDIFSFSARGEIEGRFEYVDRRSLCFPVPEPSSAMLMLLGLACVARIKRVH